MQWFTSRLRAHSGSAIGVVARPAAHRRAWVCPAVITLFSAPALLGCGSGSHVPTVEDHLPAAHSSPVPPPPKPSVGSNPNSAPDFTVMTTTTEGDKVKVEGRIGKLATPSEAGVDPNVLSTCPSPASDGRALTVSVALSITLESSLAGEVEVITGRARGSDFFYLIMPYNTGAECKPLAEASEAKISFKNLQPHQTEQFVMSAILPDAVTPNEPHPSEASLSKKSWFLEVPTATVNGQGAPAEVYPNPKTAPRVSGPRIATCAESESPEKYVPVLDSMPTKLTNADTEHDPCP